MNTAVYRIESASTVSFRLMPKTANIDLLFGDRSVAVAMATKGITDPPGNEIRVIHITSGEVVFRKQTHLPVTGDDT
jgi:hypothetical protein